MARGTFRGVVTAWLGLIALRAAAKHEGASGRVAEAFRDLDSIVERVKDPNVPAIKREVPARASDDDQPAPASAPWSPSTIPLPFGN